VAVAIGIFRHKKIIADQQRRLHRPGRNIEGLEEEGADNERNDQGVKDHASGFGNTAFFSLCSCCHAHLPLHPFVPSAPGGRRVGDPVHRYMEITLFSAR
jgi:hypothetical protein